MVGVTKLPHTVKEGLKTFIIFESLQNRGLFLFPPPLFNMSISENSVMWFFSF